MTMMNTLKVVAAATALLSLQGCFNSEIKTAKDYQDPLAKGRLEDILKARSYCSDQKWTTRDEQDKSVTVINGCDVKLEPQAFQEGIEFWRQNVDAFVQERTKKLKNGLNNAEKIVAILQHDPDADLDNYVYIGREMTNPRTILGADESFIAQQKKNLELWKSAQEPGLAKIEECRQHSLQSLEERTKAITSAQYEEIIEFRVIDKQIKFKALDMRINGKSLEANETGFPALMDIFNRNSNASISRWSANAISKIITPNLNSGCKYLPPELGESDR